MTDPRPISAALEKEVRGELRRRGIVVWLDRDDCYSGFVDSLAERCARDDFPYPVVPFRGSFLETMLALEDLETGLDQTPLLIHMPGFTEEMMRGTPLLELYKAGYRFRRA
ncbi:MAG: PglZ domain-containing protein, partial [Actinobacteria bacterium]|nr:PglZ domain-containing protein [Actinomycetota bacterium]